MTAADTRYGRRGGRWAPKGLDRSTPGVCATCCRGDARYTATNTRTPNERPWPVCATCADQGRRLSPSLTYQPIAQETGSHDRK
jgi:hypothetical protein